VGLQEAYFFLNVIAKDALSPVPLFFEINIPDDVSCEIPKISAIVMVEKTEYMFFYSKTKF
jgi:hypothetical protein